MKKVLEEGMFVRTKNGLLCKIININDFREPSAKYGVEANYLIDIAFIGEEGIKKASFNIIDLIEEGDFVNDKHIQEIISLENNKMECMVDSDYEFITTIRNEDIETVVTKEQFESRKYRVK